MITMVVKNLKNGAFQLTSKFEFFNVNLEKPLKFWAALHLALDPKVKEKLSDASASKILGFKGYSRKALGCVKWPISFLDPRKILEVNNV